MGGRRSTKEELEQIEALTSEGLTTREIAERLNRSESAIRNLRYKKQLANRAKDETKALFQQRDELAKVVKNLQGQKNVLSFELEYLKTEKAKLEATINATKNYPQEALAQKLISLKQQRPDLFYMTTQDQISQLISIIGKVVFS